MTGKEKAQPASDTTQEKAEGQSAHRPHLAEAQEHVKWIEAQFKKGLKERREQRDREAEEARRKAEALADGETDPEFKKLLKASTIRKVVAYFHELDYRNSYRLRSYTDGQIKKLIASIPKSESAITFSYQCFYNALRQYSMILSGIKLAYVAEAQKLTRLIDLYESYLADAKVWGDCVKDGSMGVGAGISFEFGQGEDGRLWADRRAGSGWGTLYLYPDGSTKVDIDGEGRLYSRMEEQSESTAQKLSAYKGYIEALSDFLYSSDTPTWELIPASIDMLLEYPDSIEEQGQEAKGRYFRYRLHQRREKGEAITPEEEKWALYPDYNEVETDEATYQYAKAILSTTLKLWDIDANKIKAMCKALTRKGRK